MLVISVEGNLTSADAYYSGQAAQYGDSETFYSVFLATMGELARDKKIPTDYCECLRVADPHTLWTLGRSVVSYSEPGRAFATLPCPKVYYWDEASTLLESRRFLAQGEIMQRQFSGVGHWPMSTSPVSFYAALEADIVSAM